MVCDVMQRANFVFVFLLVELNRGYSRFFVSGYVNVLPFFDMILHFTLIDAQDSQL